MIIGADVNVYPLISDGMGHLCKHSIRATILVNMHFLFAVGLPTWIRITVACD